MHPSLLGRLSKLLKLRFLTFNFIVAQMPVGNQFAMTKFNLLYKILLMNKREKNPNLNAQKDSPTFYQFLR
ncbi:hypothetical protein AFK68_17265 [Hydrocoleum sp. CS-953]|uniref:hypothetical protein n=1 Tax=Hydrocoleum sp. CS-953 TaxID=1671698 RepID=UPI000B9AC22E|nr:hypothetical protein [Hydrocoleum sp. CS-953]OZH53492.1 hypothetical protein AFK68_17265 [Hydrocoleum sp. CS-953]